MNEIKKNLLHFHKLFCEEVDKIFPDPNPINHDEEGFDMEEEDEKEVLNLARRANLEIN